MFEWVSACLMPNEQFFMYMYIMERVTFRRDDDKVHFVLDKHVQLDFYIASSLKQQSTGRHIAPLRYIILILSQPVFVLAT